MNEIKAGYDLQSQLLSSCLGFVVSLNKLWRNAKLQVEEKEYQ